MDSRSEPGMTKRWQIDSFGRGPLSRMTKQSGLATPRSFDFAQDKLRPGGQCKMECSEGQNNSSCNLQHARMFDYRQSVKLS